MLEQSSFEFVFKNKMRFGPGIANALPDALEEFGFQRIGFVIDKNLYEYSELAKEVLERVQKKYRSAIVCFYDEKFEPSYDYVDRVKLQFKEENQPLVDCIVGIGGGSAMDTAKVMAILCNNHEPALTYRGFPKNLTKPLPVIAIPSTAGTGSEVVYNAPLIDSQNKFKRGINDLNNYPILALLDPKMIAGAPRQVAISSGCDALVHTLESFVSRKANDLTRMFSREAFANIINTLPKLASDMNNLEYCAKMQWGAYLAMVALSNSSPGPAGALSDYLGCHFNVPHGIAGAVFIGKVTRLNHELGYYDYSTLYPLLDTHDPYLTDKRKKSEAVVKAIEGFLRAVEIPDDLSSFGVTALDHSGFMAFVVEKAKAVFDFNPVRYSDVVTSELLKEMIVV